MVTLNTLAVCDTDREFMQRLAAYAAAKAGYPFSLQIFSSIEQLLDCRRKKQPEAILLAGELYHKKDWEDYDRPVFLLGNGFASREELSQIFRYQDAEGILQDIVKAYTALVPEVHAGGIKGSFRLYAVTDAAELSVTEWLAWELARYLSETQRVLFANLRAWPVTIGLTGAQGQADLGELLYCLCEKKTEFMGRLMAMATGWQGIDLLPVAQVPADLGQVQIRDWKVFWDVLRRDSPYTAVVVAAGTLLQPAEDFLELFDEVWLVETNSQQQKQALWKQYMGVHGSQRLTKRLKILQISQDTNSAEYRSGILRQLIWHAMDMQEGSDGNESS